MHRLALTLGFAFVAGLPAVALSQTADGMSLASRDSFRIGTEGLVLCTAQSSATDRALTDMFDRGYAIVCRDAAGAVGQIYALRTRGGDPTARLAGIRADRVTCHSAGQAEIEGLGAVESLDCRLNAADVAYRVYTHRAGEIVYVAEGLGGYDSALRLALRSVIEDRVVPGEVSIATTGAGDPVAFARAQAGALDRQRALAEAYRRNNAGNFAESAEFFAVLSGGQTDASARAEAVVNEALQRSNLGRYAEADILFAQAVEIARADPVTARRYRNYRAMHLLNQGLTAAALEELDRPLPEAEAPAGVRELVIDSRTAARLSAESPGAQQLAGIAGLTERDKARILDGQARQIRGTILFQQGRRAEAVSALTQALDELVAIRGGRIAATVWLRAQIFGELARIAEAEGSQAEAERRHREAIALLDVDYPDSSALFSAKGRLAAFYARTGRTEPALSLFREIVAANADGGAPALRRTLDPYFELLAERTADPGAVEEMFTASQVLVRPGVAQTQAILARELSGGSDEAARLFRQSINLTREIERTRVELARLEAGGDAAPAAPAGRIAELRASLTQLRETQIATQARLADFPRYRVVAGDALSLADLRRLLRPGEAYYKLVLVGDDAYALFVTPDAARAYRTGITPDDLETRVDRLRRTITVMENGVQLTYPFNVELAHQLYRDLFAPIEGELAGVTHLVFEPDGGMLRLPPNLLVMDQAGVEAYRARAAESLDNEFDFRGIAWLGRQRDVSTAVSARAFRDVRAAPRSRARNEYLGFGQNVPAQGFLQAGGGTRGASRDDCAWSLAAWGRPISAAELFSARRAIGAEAPGEADIVTGEAFTDTAIRNREDLSEYRILHFATHGLVTPPRPECPAEPALLTSFGSGESDGLLSFSEIFDLRLDADLIVLSACDTAGRAGLAVTQAAGLTSGGDFALDGLVRAFIGAGGRLVVASHWPVPDDYNATQRLISGMFSAPAGSSIAGALGTAERALMDQADTSHPYYWAGFAVIGDGAAPIVRATPVQTASAE